MGTGDDAAGLLAAVLATSLPVLVDADGITLLARHRELLPRAAPTLLTPHAGELSRLTGADRDAIEARRLEHVTAAAAQLGVTVLLKGSTTVIASPEDDVPVLVNSTGTPWLATAGSGDVLSGLAGALLAQGLPPAQAAAAAAYLHGVAGAGRRRRADQCRGPDHGASCRHQERHPVPPAVTSSLLPLPVLLAWLPPLRVPLPPVPPPER